MSWDDLLLNPFHRSRHRRDLMSNWNDPHVDHGLWSKNVKRNQSDRTHSSASSHYFFHFFGFGIQAWSIMVRSRLCQCSFGRSICPKHYSPRPEGESHRFSRENQSNLHLRMWIPNQRRVWFFLLCTTGIIYALYQLDIDVCRLSHVEVIESDWNHVSICYLEIILSNWLYRFATTEMRRRKIEKKINEVNNELTLVMPLVMPKRFFTSQLSTLDVPYITYLPLNFRTLKPRSQSSPAIQSRIRSTPSGEILSWRKTLFLPALFLYLTHFLISSV